MRVKRGVVSRRKHKKLLASTRGYRMTKSRLIGVAREASLHAGEYAFAGRRRRKRDFRKLWISRISEAVKLNGLSYSQFISKLKAANITLDRKILAQLINEEPEVFEEIVDSVKSVN